MSKASGSWAPFWLFHIQLPAVLPLDWWWYQYPPLLSRVRRVGRGEKKRSTWEATQLRKCESVVTEFLKPTSALLSSHCKITSGLMYNQTVDTLWLQPSKPKDVLPSCIIMHGRPNGSWALSNRIPFFGTMVAFAPLQSSVLRFLQVLTPIMLDGLVPQCLHAGMGLCFICN